MKRMLVLSVVLLLSLSLFACGSGSKDNDQIGNGNGSHDVDDRAVIAFQRLIAEAETNVDIQDVRWICYINHWTNDDVVDGCIYFIAYRHSGDSTDRFARVRVVDRSWLENTSVSFNTLASLAALNSDYDDELSIALAVEQESHIATSDVTTGTMTAGEINATLSAALS
ncbi:MAG: hypothetical protein EA375_04715 [Acholeplasmataceae bacterium]|nr:MAG: hypothetical protein EA375_04715 [Acholeplasmataceae bacterium]